VVDFYRNPVDKQLKNMVLPDIRAFLESATEELKLSDFSLEDLQNRLNGLLEKLGTKPGILFAALRIAVTGSKASPELFGTLHVLGKEKSLDRLQKVIASLAN
jgi:glutamyl-tRNA synthetase